MIDRLPPPAGEWIDRTRELHFTFEGRPCVGFEGDTISSALWANGERILGRSFKYHRPRGIYTLADGDANALFALDDATNVRGDLTPLVAGMNVRGLNTRGGLRRDFNRFTEHLSAFMPVGFYYKAFHRPRTLFPYWERFFRRMAGLGAVDPRAPFHPTPKEYGTCDVLVVGSGPSGLAAAARAAESGASVLLVEADPRLGGSLAYDGEGADRRPIERVEALEREGRLTVRRGTVAAGAFADGWIALVDRHRLTKLRARAVVLAMGAHEQPAVFRNNDLPGVMLGSAAQRLVHRYAVRPFRRGVVLAANPEGYRVARMLLEAGVDVAAVADLQPEGDPSDYVRAVEDRGVAIYRGWGVYEAESASGKAGVRATILCPVSADGTPDLSRTLRIPCDGLAVSVGWTPADGLLRQAGGRMAYARELEQFVPDRLPAGYEAAGRLNGVYRLEARIRDGERAGAAAARQVGFDSVDGAAAAERESRSHPWAVFAHPNGRNFVDLDEDLQLKDFEHAVQEGYDNPELLKRYSTVGMGPSQGKHANLLSLRILDRLGRLRREGSALTTARPFTTPVALKFLAGRSLHPVRRTPLHEWHERHGAVFLYAGNWLRPEYYRMADRTREESIREEARAVREAVGLIDVGTLGKIEVRGPDAAEFIERLYTGSFARLRVGMTRYGITCNEAGVVTGDGVVARAEADRFYLTAPTAGADSIYREFQRWALRWGMQVTLVNLTGAYTGVNLAGPRSAAVLAPLTDIDLRPESFPYLGYREGRVAGVPARVMRVGFVGELGYEIHVPAGYGLHLWEALFEAGTTRGLRPFGIEAQRLLRLEKGHFIVGQDSDSMSDPFEFDVSWAIRMDKPFFVGQRSLRILQDKPKRRRSVGFLLPEGFAGPPPHEGNLILDAGALVGRVTSIGFSPARNRYVGLALVDASHGEAGAVLRIKLNDGTVAEAHVTNPPFYDPEGARQKDVAGAVSPPPRRFAAPVRRGSIFAAPPGTVWKTVQSSRVARHFGEPEKEAERVCDLALCDTSAFQRLSIRFQKDPREVEGFPLPVPDRILAVAEGTPGVTVARSGARELFVEDRTEDGRWAACLFEAHDDAYAVYPREDGGVLITGARANAVLRQVCSYPFVNGERKLIMTQAASVVVWAIHETVDGCPVFRLSFGNPVAHYLWETLEKIVVELGGAVVGFDAARPYLYPDAAPRHDASRAT